MLPMRLSVGTTITGGVAGSVGAGQIAYGQSLDVLTSSANLTFDGSTFTANAACTLGTGAGNLAITAGGAMTFSGAVGIEAGAGTDTMFRVRGNSATTGTLQFGTYSDTIFSSSATSGIYGFYAAPQLANAAFTCGFAIAFHAAGIAKIGGTANIDRAISFQSAGQTQGTHNAWASDNVSFAGNYVFNFTSTNPSSFAGQMRVASLGVANSAAATTLGSVTRRIEFFDGSGASLGFVPVYDSIT